MEHGAAILERLEHRGAEATQPIVATEAAAAVNGLHPQAQAVLAERQSADELDGFGSF